MALHMTIFLLIKDIIPQSVPKFFYDVLFLGLPICHNGLLENSNCTSIYTGVEYCTYFLKRLFGLVASLMGVTKVVLGISWVTWIPSGYHPKPSSSNSMWMSPFLESLGNLKWGLSSEPPPLLGSKFSPYPLVCCVPMHPPYREHCVTKGVPNYHYAP